jgi:hypothetical protein
MKYLIVTHLKRHLCFQSFLINKGLEFNKHLLCTFIDNLDLDGIFILNHPIAILASFVNFLLPPLTKGRVGVG